MLLHLLELMGSSAFSAADTLSWRSSAAVAVPPAELQAEGALFELLGSHLASG